MSSIRLIEVPERGRREIPDDGIWKSLRENNDFGKLLAAGYIEALYRPKGVCLKGGAYVGRAVIGDFRVQIREKSKGTLAALLAYASHDAFKTHDLHTDRTEPGDLAALLINRFLGLVGDYPSQGREFTYASGYTISSLAGGRLDIPKTLLLRAKGRIGSAGYHKNAISYRTPLNRIVAAALSGIEKLSGLIPLWSGDLSKTRGFCSVFADLQYEENFSDKDQLFACLNDPVLRADEEAKEETLSGIRQAILEGRDLRNDPFVRESEKAGYKFTSMTFEHAHNKQPYSIDVKIEFKFRPVVFEVGVDSFRKIVGFSEQKERAELRSGDEIRMKTAIWQKAREVYNTLILPEQKQEEVQSTG